MAGTTGLEPATSDVTGRRSNQLNYVPEIVRRRSHSSTAAGDKLSPLKGAHDLFCPDPYP